MNGTATRRPNGSVSGQAQRTSPTRSTATPTSGTTDKKDNFTAYKLLIADVVGGKLEAVPRGVMAAGNIMEGARGGIDLPKGDIDRVKSHLAKYYKKMGETAPWERD